jgi:ribonuclease HI
MKPKTQSPLCIMIMKLFTDGGLVGRNPSSVGGVWAYCIVDDKDEAVTLASGFVPAPQGREITNNHMEMIAAVKGFEALLGLLPHPADWTGEFWSDSQVTIMRLFQGAKWNNVPANVRNRAETMIEAFGLGKNPNIKPILCAGHPTKKELAAGIKNKEGKDYPVSVFNKYCDDACRKESKAHKQ